MDEASGWGAGSRRGEVAGAETPSRRRHAKRIGVLAAAGTCLIAAAALCPWRLGVVTGESMAPTLASGTLFVYERACAAPPPQAGEIVVALVQGVPTVKRVYATGGASFWTLREPLEGCIRRDPIQSADRRRFEVIAAQRRLRQGRDFRVHRFKVPPGFVFLVGDGVTSEDSRSYGLIAAEKIIGRVLALPGQSFADRSPGIELGFPARNASAEGTARSGDG